MKKNILALLLLLTSCADTDVVKIDQSPDVYYVTNVYETYLTEVTEVYTTEITNITEITEVTEIIYGNEGASIIAFIYPCGSGSNKEVLLKLSTGDILAVYDGDTASDLQQTRLAVIANGNYVTTHGAGDCNFSVNNGKVTGSQVIVQNLGSSTTPPTTPSIDAQFMIEKFENGQLVDKWYVRNVGQLDYAILDSTGAVTQSHGFVVNNNANNLGKGQCNINNLSGVSSTQVFENCKVTKL